MQLNYDESTRRLLAASRYKAAVAIFCSCIFTTAFLFAVSNHFSSEMTQTRQTQLRQRVDLALDAIAPFLQKIHEGNITPEAGLQMVLPMIRRMTFVDERGSNYFFIITYDGILLLQPFEPYLENTDPNSLEYKVNHNAIYAILAAARQSPEGGYVRYSYSHPNLSGLKQKESYVVSIPELGVVLGSGYYISDTILSPGQRLLFSGGAILLLSIIVPFFLCMKKSNRQIRLLSETVHVLQKQEHELKDTSYKYHTILDNSLEGIVILQNFTIQLANNAFCNLTGYTMEELHHLDLAQLFHPDDAGLILDRHRRRLAGEHVPSQNSFRLIEKNGSFRWMLANTTSIMWQNQPAALSMLFDITTQRSTQNELQAEQACFRYFMENAPFPIAIFSQDGFLRHVNKRCTSIWKIEEMALVDSYNVFTDAQLQHEPVRSQIRRAFTGETIVTDPISYASNNLSSGIKHTIRFRLYPAFHGDGKLKNVILVHDDMSDNEEM